MKYGNTRRTDSESFLKILLCEKRNEKNCCPYYMMESDGWMMRFESAKSEAGRGGREMSAGEL